MNDFDRFLELELRQMLDPVVGVRPPRRRGIPVTSRPVLTLEAPNGDLAPEPIAAEPAVVVVPVAPAQL